MLGMCLSSAALACIDREVQCPCKKQGHVIVIAALQCHAASNFDSLLVGGTCLEVGCFCASLALLGSIFLESSSCPKLGKWKFASVQTSAASRRFSFRPRYVILFQQFGWKPWLQLGFASG